MRGLRYDECSFPTGGTGTHPLTHTDTHTDTDTDTNTHTLVHTRSGRKSMFGRAIQGASSVRKSVAFRGFKGV